jgi:hypothetical protein
MLKNYDLPYNLVADVVTVQRGAKLVEYLGISVYREAEVFPEGYEEIPPGGSIVTDVDILPMFDFAYEANYTISYTAVVFRFMFARSCPATTSIHMFLVWQFRSAKISSKLRVMVIYFFNGQAGDPTTPKRPNRLTVMPCTINLRPRSVTPSLSTFPVNFV